VKGYWVRIAKVWAQRFLWMLVGALLALASERAVFEWGRAVVGEKLARFLAANPQTENEVEKLFAGATHYERLVRPGDAEVVRYRFLYGEDIDVIYDRSGRVQEVIPAFAQSWGRPWPLIHRVRRERVVLTSPLTEP